MVCVKVFKKREAVPKNAEMELNAQWGTCNFGWEMKIGSSEMDNKVDEMEVEESQMEPVGEVDAVVMDTDEPEESVCFTPVKAKRRRVLSSSTDEESVPPPSSDDDRNPPKRKVIFIFTL